MRIAKAMPLKRFGLMPLLLDVHAYTHYLLYLGAGSF
jgi:hypothetical protein